MQIHIYIYTEHTINKQMSEDSLWKYVPLTLLQGFEKIIQG